MIFVDTSAFLALIAVEDAYHRQAKACLQAILQQNQTLLTNNYVLIETLALLQKRLGLAKVQDFLDNLLPLVLVEWVDEETHQAAVERLLSANRRKLSLVDCSAFETMRRAGVETVFTFDEHFGGEGFQMTPQSD